MDYTGVKLVESADGALLEIFINYDAEMACCVFICHTGILQITKIILKD